MPLRADDGGNPWILTTAALAQLLYRVGVACKQGQGPDAETMQVGGARRWTAGALEGWMRVAGYGASP